MNVKPLLNLSLPAAAVVYGVLLRLAAAAGLFGMALGIIVTFALWRYAYQVLREVAHGRQGPETVSDFNGVPIVLHFLFFGLLAVLLGTTPLLGAWPVADAIRSGALVVVLATFPASAALMGITNSLVAALNPWRIGGVIAVLGRRYLTLLGACAVLTFATAATESLLGRGGGILTLVGSFVSVWSFLALFALVGSAIRDCGDDFDLQGEPELRAEREEAERHREWQKSLDRAYASIRGGLVDQGYATIKDLARSEQDSLEIYQWLFNRMITWEDRTHALALGKRFVERLLASGREYTALELADQCRRTSPAFSLPADTVEKLSEYARSVGRHRLADELAALTAG